MSWSIALIGKPENVVAELRRESEKMTPGQCKIEFDDALPHLIGLVQQNFVAEGEPGTLPLIKLDASGSGCSRGHGTQDGAVGVKQVNRTCRATIEYLYTKLV